MHIGKKLPLYINFASTFVLHLPAFPAGFLTAAFLPSIVHHAESNSQIPLHKRSFEKIIESLLKDSVALRLSRTSQLYENVCIFKMCKQRPTKSKIVFVDI